MRRVKSDRCGYEGYRCRGVGNLKEVFTTLEMLCDDQGAYRVSNFEAPGGGDYIDNYLNLPTSMKGFMITTDHLLDMSNIPVQPQELTCAESFNTSGTGLINGLYDYYSSKVDAAATQSTTATKDVVWELMLHRTFCFLNTPLMWPGILEPMIDTAFPPVGLDVNIATDVALDGAMLALVQLTKWRIQVDNRLNRISAMLSRIAALRNLLSAMNRQSICEDFKISLAKGSPIAYEEPVSEIDPDGPLGPLPPSYPPGYNPSTDPDRPQYNIADGKVKLNGDTILTVKGTENIPAPFYAYVNIYLEDPDEEGHYTDAEAKLELSPDGNASFGIGGVKVVKGDHQRGTPTYWLYEIFQERCTLSVEMVRTSKEGFLYKLAGGAVPFKVVEGADCDEEEEEPSPESTPEPEQ